MKTQLQTPTQKPVAAAVAGVLSKEQTDKRKGASTKAQSKREKVPAGRDWGQMGSEDARLLYEAEKVVGEERIKIIQHVRVFAPFGFGATKEGSKKQKFSEAAESYFAGARKWINEQDESIQASLRQRIGEVARVLYAYITMGVDKVDAILNGPGSYHYKIGQLPTRTTRPAKQPKGENGGDKVENKTLAEVEKMADKEQRTVFSKFTAKEVGNMVAGLPDEVLPVLLHALTIRLKASKDKAYKALGNSVKEWLDKDAIADAAKKAA